MSEKKAKPKPPEKPQSERFIEFAEEHGADDPKAVDKVLSEIARAARRPKAS